MNQTSIGNLLINRAIERLIADLQTLVDESDVTRANTVRHGFLQDDPTTGTGITVMVYSNDPTAPGAWEHSVTGIGQDMNVGNSKYSYDVWGNELWYYRFSCFMKMFYKQTLSREKSVEYTHLILSRAQVALKNMLNPTSVEQDSFGNCALNVFPVRSEVTLTGGPGQFIGNAKIFFQVLVGLNF